MQILIIQPHDTYQLRQLLPMHRNGQVPIAYPDDSDEKSFHLGNFVEKKLVSIASFYFSKHPDIDALYQYEVRGLTRPDMYRKGCSRALLEAAYPLILQNQGHILWCYSSGDSIAALLAIGLKPIGSPQEISDFFGTSVRQLMYKRIQ
ncbi:MAG: hypothetical protein HQK50_14545 [Oligoflexia bacterium]|nr:hypothetical protein [Oligoflexia bacterium]MBF0366790.1 hypothetical protein [Oligoflexia bacterium]